MHDRDPTAARRPLPVWLPWLLAPAFALLPVLGCGAAATLKHGRSVAIGSVSPAVTPPLVPVTAVVTALPSGR